MGLNLALDELRSTGWTDLDSTGCTYDSDGRAYPSVSRAREESSAAGAVLDIRRVEKFDCFRAEWADPATGESQSVVARTEAEAAVFALAKVRRSHMLAAV